MDTSIPSAKADSAADATGDLSAAGELRLGVAANGDLRWAVVDLTAPLEAARQRLDLSPVAAVALGRAMASAALVLRFTTKSPGRLLFEIRGDGPLGKVLAEIDAEGHLRGLVGDGRVATPDDGSLAIAEAVGQGLLKVTRESERGRYESQVELVSGEIGGDLVHFLEQSQQIRSAALLGVLPRPEGIVAAGGVLVEAFPGVPEDVLSTLETSIGAMGGEISPLLQSAGVDGVLDALFCDFDRQELERFPLTYHCRCSAEKLRQSLASLTSEQLMSACDDRGQCRAQCAFCGAEYTFDSQELMSH